MIRLAHIREAWHILSHARRVSRKGPAHYTGDAEEICRQIVERCWTGTHYIASVNNYPCFYSRDFGMCIDSLLALGQKERVKKTLEYALACYKTYGTITQQIGKNTKPFNFPDCEQPDAYAFLLYSIVALDDKKLIQRYRDFIEKDVQRFVTAVVDRKTGLIKQGLHVAGMRDHALRNSSCYDNTMLAAIQQYGKILEITTLLEEYKYQQLLVKHFWNGKHFKDDLSSAALTGDANVLPFWFKIFKSKTRFRSVLAALQQQKLDRPYPLRYEAHRNKEREMLWVDAFTNGWEHDTVWLHLGNLFLQVVAEHAPKEAERYLAQYRLLIEKERHYPELLSPNGEPHASWFFHADDSMLWAANFLELTHRPLR